MGLTAFYARHQRLARDREPYVGGLTRHQVADILAVDESEIVKLSSNENPIGASPTVIEAIVKSAKLAPYYPTSIATELHEAIGSYLGVSASQVVSGPGSSTLMHTLVTACSEPDAEIVWIEPGFTLYPEIAKVHGRRAVAVSTKGPDFRPDPAEIIAAISLRTAIVFVTRPNNPTSVMLSRDHFAEVAAAAREVGAIVISDEAYIEFADRSVESAVELLKADPDLYENVIVSRTFSKAFGLANLRLGYMVGCESLIDLVSAANAKWPTGDIVRAAGIAALADSDHLDRTRAVVSEGRKFLTSAFRDLGFEVVDGAQGNYVMVDVRPRNWSAEDFARNVLEAAHVMIRGDFSVSHVRISVGTHSENQRLVEAVARLVNEREGH